MIEVNEPELVTAFCRNCGKIFQKPHWSKKTCCTKRCEAIRAYQNGKNFMREEILKMLQNLKKSQLGVTRATISDVIEMIEKLDVRP